MAKCEWCGKRFNRVEANDEFAGEYDYLSYSSFRPTLCFDCAVQAIEEGADGVYFDTCEKCGSTFDYASEKSRFENGFTWYSATSLKDCWDKADLILCADCAMEYVN